MRLDINEPLRRQGRPSTNDPDDTWLVNEKWLEVKITDTKNPENTEAFEPASEKGPASQLTYRRDIDGLRAIAVLTVVGFHAFPDAIEGGFIGVDMFFVISGYLISSIIITGIERGTFSFSDFYSRRIRRIFPALLLVLATCLVFGWVALLATEYGQMAKHVAAGAGFVSNFVLWSESGYFDNDSETKPLLHLWSLGIEEQFYIVWPLLLWLGWKVKANPVWLILVVAVASFSLNVFRVGNDAVATFYSPVTRFWELLIGSLLAYSATRNRTRVEAASSRGLLLSGERHSPSLSVKITSLARNAAAILGALLIAIGLFNISVEESFPGFLALLPTIGTSLLIAAGSSAWINRRILSARLLVWIGLISYPLYLWHWPLLSFGRILEDQTPHRNYRILAVLFAILLSALTYRFVETPIRFGKYRSKSASILLLIMVTLGVAGYIIYASDGLPSRKAANPAAFYNGDIGHTEFHKYIAENFYACTPDEIAASALRWDGFVRCMQSRNDRPVDLAIIGDSHAEHLFIGLAEHLPDRNVVFYIRGAMPFIDEPEFTAVFDHVLKSKSIVDVVITMHWKGRFSTQHQSSLFDTIGALTEADDRTPKAEPRLMW